MRAILTYHSIDDSGSAISTSPASFRRQMSWLARSDVAVVPLAEVAGREGSGHAIALTFDDAFANFDAEAWPVLEEHGLPATIFVPTSHAGGRNAWENGGRLPVLPLLDWGSLGRLAEAGLVLGSHTATHPDLRSLDGPAVERELDRAIERIRAETGRDATTFAYPYGRFDEQALAAVRARHSLAVTTEFRALRPGEDACRLPRLDALYFGRDGLLETFGTNAFARFIAVRRGLRRVRRLFSGD
jgi:peptidoglycan/xylan/chitin deacetylase (PgdA/CDA1 family)